MCQAFSSSCGFEKAAKAHNVTIWHYQTYCRCLMRSRRAAGLSSWELFQAIIPEKCYCQVISLMTSWKSMLSCRCTSHKNLVLGGRKYHPCQLYTQQKLEDLQNSKDVINRSPHYIWTKRIKGKLKIPDGPIGNPQLEQ